MSSYSEKIDECLKPPSKGGAPITELKQLASSMGVDVRSKNKEQICEAMKSLLTDNGDSSD